MIDSMTKTPEDRSPSGRAGRSRTRVDQAFDTWLDRELQRMFNDVAREPIPEDLLRLIDSQADPASNPTDRVKKK